MIDDILNDFFSFVSRDKILITADDLRRLESNLDKQEFEDILDQLEEFLNDFVFWSLQKLKISVDDNTESSGNKIVYYLFKLLGIRWSEK
jgi:hypothetical protein